MRITILSLIFGLILGCSGRNNPVAPPVPDSLIGDYTGTVSYWQYKDTDSAVTAAAEIEFSFISDTTYFYKLSYEYDCGGGGVLYEYDNGLLNLRSTIPYLAMCAFGYLEFLVGEFRVTGTERAILFYQELPDIDLVRTIELNRVYQ